MYVVGYVGCGEILLGADWEHEWKKMTFHSVFGEWNNHPNRGSFFFHQPEFPSHPVIINHFNGIFMYFPYIGNKHP